MYKIVSDTGQVIGYTDKVRYIKKHINGCYVECPSDEAEGVAFKSIPYSLGTDNPLEGAVCSVYLYYEEAGDILFKNAEDIVDTQNATCELSEELDERISDLENALCELSELTESEE